MRALHPSSSNACRIRLLGEVTGFTRIGRGVLERQQPMLYALPRENHVPPSDHQTIRPPRPPSTHRPRFSNLDDTGCDQWEHGPTNHTHQNSCSKWRQILMSSKSTEVYAQQKALKTFSLFMRRPMSGVDAIVKNLWSIQEVLRCEAHIRR